MAPNDAALVKSSRMMPSDAWAEAINGLLARPTRTILTLLGTMLGISILVATLGLAKTAGYQIAVRFDEVAATSVVVEVGSESTGLSAEGVRIPWDAEERLKRLSGVTAAGTLTPVNIGAQRTRAVPLRDPRFVDAHPIPVIAASPGLLEAVRGRLRAGRWLDSGFSGRADHVVVLGAGAAERLNITELDRQPVIFVGDQAYTVIGILASVERQPGLVGGAIIPEGTARAIYDVDTPALAQIETEPGTASSVSVQAPVSLAPNNPQGLQVLKAPEPSELREQVQGDVNWLFVGLGGVSLLIGAIGIANVTLVSVLERTAEIGLRRAVGAYPRHIAAQFVLESSIMGLVGGVFGTTVGLLFVVGISAAQSWQPVMSYWTLLSMPFLGAVVGLLAGIYPALRAAFVEPVKALRTA